MTWQVEPPRHVEPCYYFKLARTPSRALRRYPSSPSLDDRRWWPPAYLTYNLTGSDRNERALLLIKRTKNRPRAELLLEPDVTAVAQLEKRLLEQRMKRGGALGAAKAVVNEFYEEPDTSGQFAVAVHKLGPVPVCILSEPVEIELLGKRLTACVGVYPDIPVAGDSGFWPRVFPNRREFLRSLQPDLDLILRRYFEDVAEYLFDLENHFPLDQAGYGCRKIQETLGASVDTKVDPILYFSKSQAEEGNLAVALLEKYPYPILVARMVRAFAQLFVNELLEVIGLESRSYKYWNDVRSLQKESHESVVPKPPRSSALQGTELNVLEAAAEGYWRELDSDTFSADPLPIVPSTPLWLRRFVRFVDFIRRLRLDEARAEHITISVTGQSAEKLSEAMVEAAGGEGDISTLRILGLASELAATEENDRIRGRIWSSDTVALLPPSKDLANARLAEECRRILQEIDFALGLGKRLFCVGAGLEAFLKKLSATLEDDIVPLEPELRRSFLKDAILTELSKDNLLDLARPDAQTTIGRIPAIAGDFRLMHRLGSALGFVATSRREQKALVRLQKYAKAPRAREQLSPLVFPGRSGRRALQEFDNLWDRVQKRPVIVETEPLLLMNKDRATNKFSAGYVDIALRIRPGISRGRAARLVRRILERFEDSSLRF